MKATNDAQVAEELIAIEQLKPLYRPPYRRMPAVVAEELIAIEQLKLVGTMGSTTLSNAVAEELIAIEQLKLPQGWHDDEKYPIHPVIPIKRKRRVR